MITNDVRACMKKLKKHEFVARQRESRNRAINFFKLYDNFIAFSSLPTKYFYYILNFYTALQLHSMTCANNTSKLCNLFVRRQQKMVKSLIPHWQIDEIAN